MSREVIVRAIVAAIALIAVAAMVVDWNDIAWHGADQTTNDAQLRGDPTPMQARVTGYVAEVAVDDNQPVHRGDLLYRIEDADYRARVDQAQAMLDQARAAVQQGEAQVGLAVAQVASTDAQAAEIAAEAVRARQERQRQDALLHTAGGRRQDWENATADEARQTASLQGRQVAGEAARRQVDQLRADLDRARAQVQARQGELDFQRVQLSYTKIRAPEDGQVTARLVFRGAYVMPGTTLLTFVPLARIWVESFYREEQVANMRPGQRARIHVDAFPVPDLHGHVNSIGPLSQARTSLLPPDRATGSFTKVEQRLPVRIDIDPDPRPGGRLIPGLSVETVVNTHGGGLP